jgi:hypothetical protein
MGRTLSAPVSRARRTPRVASSSQISGSQRSRATRHASQSQRFRAGRRAGGGSRDPRGRAGRDRRATQRLRRLERHRVERGRASGRRVPVTGFPVSVPVATITDAPPWTAAASCDFSGTPMQLPVKLDPAAGLLAAGSYEPPAAAPWRCPSAPAGWPVTRRVTPGSAQVRPVQRHADDDRKDDGRRAARCRQYPVARAQPLAAERSQHRVRVRVAARQGIMSRSVFVMPSPFAAVRRRWLEHGSGPG